MKKPVWVLPTAVVAIQQILLAEHGGLPGIRDQELLESALARPRQRLAYNPQGTLFDLAASYSHALARNHPFMDGNKRVTLTVGAMFLELNGYSLDAPEAEAVLIFEQLAAGDISEKAVAAWFENSSIRIG